MADLHAATSSYASGTNDTYTAVTDNVDEFVAIHQNGPASAIVAIETVLGDGSALPGSVADLATRLAVAIANTGRLNDFSSTTKTTFPPATTEGCTGNTSFTDGEIVYYAEDTSGNTIRSTGVANPSSAGGTMVTTSNTQTLTNKTLTTPTISSFANATHNHTNAAGGGLIAGNFIEGTVDTVLSTTVSDSSVPSTATATITTVASSNVFVSASAFIEDISGTVSGHISMRVYRTTTANIVCTIQLNKDSTNLPPDMSGFCAATFGVDQPGAGTITYTVDFIRSAGGSASTFVARDIQLSVIAVT